MAMFELFPPSDDVTGWLILGAVWILQIGFLLLAALGQRKWQWRLMFLVQIFLCIATYILFHHYNTASRRGIYFDDCMNTLIAAHLYTITLFVSWVFWMNRKQPST